MIKLHLLRIRNFLLGPLLILVLLTSGITPAGASDPRQDIPTIDPALLAQAARSDSLDFMILFEDQPDLSAAYEMDWEARGWYVYETLTAHAEENQARVRNFLDRTGVDYQAFWAANLIIVEGAPNAALNGLLNYTEIERMQVIPQVMLMLPEKPIEEGDDVDEGDSELEPVETPEPELINEEDDDITGEEQTFQTQETDDINLFGVESNLSQINADDAWALGYTGTGMVVGSIDTGVLYTHAALVNQYRGNQGEGSFDHNYNWWDAASGTTAPIDTQGHGTHTVGTMVGDDGGSSQIGVAPDAEWIACNAFTETSASSTDLIECGQFMLAPTNLSGTNPNPSMRPHVINNSWGDTKQLYDRFYQPTVDAWLAAGIYPVFANGNTGPALGTVGNPARYGNVTGVGALITDERLPASFSSRGPTDDPDGINEVEGFELIKPQVAAPGTGINSALPDSTNNKYGTMDGTSMAAPHVAGQVALMWQAAPCLVGQYALTETLIETTATPIYYDDNLNGIVTYPNNATGWGEINVLASVFAARNQCGDSYLSGKIFNQESSNPISHVNITVNASNNSFNDRSGKTDQNGNYQIKVYSGETYSITTQHFFYEPETLTGIEVNSSGQNIENDFYLVEINGFKTFLPLIIR